MRTESNEGIFELPPADWPALLRQINDPPKRLFCRGTPPPVDGIFLTVVGTRGPTDYGRDCLRALIGGLKGYPITIVSGLALGIDGMAHHEALKAGLRTVSFPGSSLERNLIYPAEHQNLSEQIIGAGGCLLSEYTADSMDGPWVFPRRNRLMAGCSQAALIVECTLKSGTLITSKLAHGYHREVLAVPGSIDNPMSAGPNMLIRKNNAVLVRSADDILEELGIEPRLPGAAISPERMAALDPVSRRIVQKLEMGKMNKDNLCRDLSLPMHELNALITFLEIDGFIRTNGNVVRRVG